MTRHSRTDIRQILSAPQVMLWDEKLNQEMAKMMLAEGILVIPLRSFCICAFAFFCCCLFVFLPFRVLSLCVFCIFGDGQELLPFFSFFFLFVFLPFGLFVLLPFLEMAKMMRAEATFSDLCVFTFVFFLYP